MDTVKDIMSKNVKTSVKDELVINIGKIMKKNNVSTVIIVNKNKKPIGIITERDMAQKVVAKGLNVKEVISKEVMTSPVITINPKTSIFYASELMKKEKFKKLPIVLKGELLGIVTQTDIINYLKNQRKKFVMDNLSKDYRQHYPG